MAHAANSLGFPTYSPTPGSDPCYVMNGPRETHRSLCSTWRVQKHWGQPVLLDVFTQTVRDELRRYFERKLPFTGVYRIPHLTFEKNILYTFTCTLNVFAESFANSEHKRHLLNWNTCAPACRMRISPLGTSEWAHLCGKMRVTRIKSNLLVHFSKTILLVAAVMTQTLTCAGEYDLFPNFSIQFLKVAENRRRCFKSLPVIRMFLKSGYANLDIT